MISLIVFASIVLFDFAWATRGHKTDAHFPAANGPQYDGNANRVRTNAVRIFRIAKTGGFPNPEDQSPAVVNSGD
jgi:hypothetical protein